MIPQLTWLCNAIRMPRSVTETVLEVAGQLDFDALRPYMEQLFHPGTWDEGLEKLKQALAPDPRGFKILTCNLVCALQTKKRYEAMEIPESVFLATMDCFPRFVGEHLVSFGEYGFDRDFWTMRQLACIIFRIGLLEYELQDDVIDIHIPSGTPLESNAIAQSLSDARDFLARYFPRWKNLPMVCHSWLLSPTLTQLLPESSGIRTFQSFFLITPTGEEDLSYLEWCFKREDLPLQELPENTSLQRSLKRHLLQGGRFENAKGILR